MRLFATLRFISVSCYLSLSLPLPLSLPAALDASALRLSGPFLVDLDELINLKLLPDSACDPKTSPAPPTPLPCPANDVPAERALNCF